MTRATKYAVNGLMIVICVALFFPAYLFWRDNDVSNANRVRSQAKKEYYQREYLKAYKSYQLLLDSLNVSDEAASMNYANSAYLSSNLLLDGFYGSSGKVKLPDSALTALASQSQSEYARLSGIENSAIASLAYNQLGYSALKKKDLFESGDPDSTLTSALEHFKNALRRNPENDSARYNYELIARLVAFPETIMQQTQALIAEKKYREAAELLESSMKRSPTLEKKQKEFLQRLKQVVKIDSLYARS